MLFVRDKVVVIDCIFVVLMLIDNHLNLNLQTANMSVIIRSVSIQS